MTIHDALPVLALLASIGWFAALWAAFPAVRRK